MSLIIKDMQLPRKSERRECSIAVVQNRPVSIAFSRTKTNPLECFECAEIPTPHGRLIDADKLYKKFKNEYCNRNCDSSVQGKQCDHCGVPRALNIILNAPTIIEAEVSE